MTHELMDRARLANGFGHLGADRSDDGSDDEPWLAFEMIDGFRPLVPGAILEMRPHEAVFLAPSQG